jgi:hypothetical protein
MRGVMKTSISTLSSLVGRGLEQVAEERECRQERHLADVLARYAFEDAADHRGVAVVDDDLRRSRCGRRSRE